MAKGEAEQVAPHEGREGLVTGGNGENGGSKSKFSSLHKTQLHLELGELNPSGLSLRTLKTRAEMSARGTGRLGFTDEQSRWLQQPPRAQEGAPGPAVHPPPL